jgi:hypothetical protein
LAINRLNATAQLFFPKQTLTREKLKLQNEVDDLNPERSNPKPKNANAWFGFAMSYSLRQNQLEVRRMVFGAR